MSKINQERRRFLTSALYTSIYGGLMYSGLGVPSLQRSSKATPAQLNERVLIDLFLDGGPDMRHLIVPEYSTVQDSFGQKYWENRQRSHNLSAFGQTAQQRWNDDYYHITVGGNNWNGQVDYGSLNNGVTFGILKQAGWLIDMFRAGNVAMVFNAVGGTNRAHDLSSMMLHQGNVTIGLNDTNQSGWGGRLARSAGANCIALTSSPNAFTFGPLGSSANYDPNEIDNSDLVAIENSREIGLYEAIFEDDQFIFDSHWKDKMSRTGLSYYEALKQNNLPVIYQKALQHEENVRKFGKLITSRLSTVDIPELINALYDDLDIDGQPHNPDPNDPTQARRVLRSWDFGSQIRNLYDILAVSDLETHANTEFPGEFAGFSFSPRVFSMRYGGWDTHSQQRPYEQNGIILTDVENPEVNRGIENGFRDIFSGHTGSLYPSVSPMNLNALHCGFSALWQSLSPASRNNIAIVASGEFGRQLRDNGDRGTDHGKGNLMMVISEQVNGGIYGDMFPSSEIVKYDEPVNRTPDITPLTEIDHIFSKVCDWVEPGSGDQVFPRLSSSYSGDSPIIEQAGMLNALFS